MASCSRAFRKRKCRGREEVSRKQYPKVNKCSEKVVFEKCFWNGLLVGKQKSSTRALRIHNCLVLSATLDIAIANTTAESLNFGLIKSVKEQSLIALIIHSNISPILIG